MLDLTSKETGMIDCRKVIIYITQFKCRGYLYMYMSIFKLKGSFPLLLVMWFLCIEKLNNYSAFLTLKTIVDRYM